jgi:hypothetical protein
MTASVALVPARFAPSWSDDRARLRQLARRIHSLGERPLYELFAELDDGAPLRSTLEAYARLERFSASIRDHGGDRLHGPRVVKGAS